MTNHFTKLLTALDERERFSIDWEIAFCCNRTLNFLIGIPFAVGFVCLTLVLADAVVPVAGIRFWNIWETLGTHASLQQFFDALDRCHLGAAWLDRLYIIAIVAVFFFGPAVGSLVRTSSVGRQALSVFGWLPIVALCLTTVIAATALSANFRTAGGANAGECVDQLRIESDF